MKSSKLLITLLALLIVFSSCEIKEEGGVDRQVAEQTEKMMAEGNKAVGMPNITNWNEKKIVRDLYELRDQEGLQTYTYIIDMNGRRHFLGRSIGYGIPASVQYSNPKKAVDLEDLMPEDWASHKLDKMPQPEPNGLYMPEGLSATWVFLLDDNGEPRPVYLEPEILVSPFKMH